MRKKLMRIGQSTAEYAVLLAIIVAAMIAMQFYLRRGFQGRIKDLADQISPTQYESNFTDSNYAITQTGKTVQNYDKGVSSIYQGAAPADVPPDQKGDSDSTKRTGYEKSHPETQ